MSIEAMQWAFTRDMKPSSMKFVLVSLADYAQADGLAWPSLAALAGKTGLDRKTVIAGLQRLEREGYLLDSGKRTGSTGQIKIYRFNFDHSNKPKSGTVPKKEQSRISPETVPFFPENSAVFPDKGTVFPHKSTENGTRNPQEPSLTIKEPTRNRRASKSPPEVALPAVLPDWLPQAAWQNWVEYRKSAKAAMTDKAVELSITKLETLRQQGHDPASVIDQSIMNGWTGLFKISEDRRPSGGKGFESAKDRSRRETVASLTGRKHGGSATIIDV